MARRTCIAEVASYDSFLDIMTNVAGFLIIVVVVTQLDVGTALRRAASANIAEPPGPDDLEKARAERERLLADLQRVRERWGAIEVSMEPNRAELARIASARERIEEEIRKCGKFPGRPDDLRKELAALDEELAQARKRLEEKRKEYEAVRRDEGEDPAPGSGDPGEDRIVRLPDPHPAEKGIVPFTLVCREGKIYAFDGQALGQKCNSEAEKLGSRSLAELVRHFETNDVGDEFFRIRLRDDSIGSFRRLNIKFELREGARGIGGADFPAEFSKLLGKLSPQKNLIVFLAYDDSFDIYLKARRQVERLGYPANWLPLFSGGPGDPRKEIEITLPSAPSSGIEGE